MGQADQLTTEQTQLLTQFVVKHNLQEIKLNKAESRFFFDFLDKGEELDSSRILLQPAFAEGRMRNFYNHLVVVLIPKNKLLQMDGEQWGEGFEQIKNTHTNPFTQRLLDIFSKKMGYEILINKLANELKMLYPLSQGQAKAVMMKLLGFKLTSGTRSFLHDLRNKIRKYQGLVMNFQEYVTLPADTIKLTPQTFSEELISKFSTGEKADHLEKITPQDRISGHTSRTNQLLDRQAEIVKNKEMPKLEKPIYLHHDHKFGYFCLKCKTSLPFDKDQLDADEAAPTPIHCGESMSIKLNK